MSESFIKVLWNSDFFTVWLGELWLFAGLWRRGGIVMMVVVKMWPLVVHLYLAGGCSLVQPVAVGAAYISEIWVGVSFGGEGLLATAARRQELPFLGVSPFHPAILKPDLHLHRTQKKYMSISLTSSLLTLFTAGLGYKMDRKCPYKHSIRAMHIKYLSTCSLYEGSV